MAIAQAAPVKNVESAMKLQDTYVAAENISALRAVRLINANECELGDPDTIYEDAKVVGISLTAATTGNNVEVLTFGILEDPFFTFPLNEPIFLAPNGVVTDVPPTTGFSTQIGHSLGTGQIFINIREPLEL